MLRYIATPTQTGAVVCHYSPSLDAYVVDLDCRNMEQAIKQAALRNLATAQEAASWACDSSGTNERQSARWFEIEAV